MTVGDTATGETEACTAVLVSVPEEVAERIGSFLVANGIPCRTRLNTEMTPERLVEGYLRQAPGAAQVLDTPLLGPLLRGRLTKDLSAEIDVVGSEVPPVWDVLVRPEDLPEDVGAPLQGPERPRLNVSTSSPEVGADEPAAGDPSPVVLCELPWDEAWALTERLDAAGIPAAVMATESTDRDRPMQARVVPVGVRSADLERATAFLK